MTDSLRERGIQFLTPDAYLQNLCVFLQVILSTWALIWLKNGEKKSSQRTVERMRASDT